MPESVDGARTAALQLERCRLVFISPPEQTPENEAAASVHKYTVQEIKAVKWYDFGRIYSELTGLS